MPYLGDDLLMELRVEGSAVFVMTWEFPEWREIWWNLPGIYLLDGNFKGSRAAEAAGWIV